MTIAKPTAGFTDAIGTAPTINDSSTHIICVRRDTDTLP